MSLIQFNKVYKQFVGEYILKDINFTIEDKDKIGLVGVNGAGKSTIIKMILDEERMENYTPLRVSFSHLTTKEEIDVLVEALKEISASFLIEKTNVGHR